MLQALTLLTMALNLLIAANNPSVPESLKQNAISIANFAIQVANTALKESSVASVSSAVTSPAPVTVISPPPVPSTVPPTDATLPPLASINPPPTPSPPPVPPPPPQVIYMPVPVPVSPPPPPPSISLPSPLPPPPAPIPTKIEITSDKISNPTQQQILIKNITYEISNFLCGLRTANPITPVTIPLQFRGHMNDENNHLIITSSIILNVFDCSKEEKIILTVPFNISLNSGERIFLDQFGAFSQIIDGITKAYGIKCLSCSNPEQLVIPIYAGSVLTVRIKDVLIEPQTAYQSSYNAGSIYAYSK